MWRYVKKMNYQMTPNSVLRVIARMLLFNSDVFWTAMAGQRRVPSKVKAPQIPALGHYAVLT